MRCVLILMYLQVTHCTQCQLTRDIIIINFKNQIPYGPLNKVDSSMFVLADLPLSVHNR